MSETTLDQYLDEPEKISRARNLLETQENSLAYFRGWGVDKSIMSGLNGTIQVQSISSYYRQKAFKQSIVLTEDEIRQQDFAANITYKVD